jgi:hypothetical protein
MSHHGGDILIHEALETLPVARTGCTRDFPAWTGSDPSGNNSRHNDKKKSAHNAPSIADVTVISENYFDGFSLL